MGITLTTHQGTFMKKINVRFGIGNNKVLAIKQLREATGFGLKEAKDTIDAICAQINSTPGVIDVRVLMPPETYGLLRIIIDYGLGDSQRAVGIILVDPMIENHQQMFDISEPLPGPSMPVTALYDTTLC
jgi:hypothetical protein